MDAEKALARHFAGCEPAIARLGKALRTKLRARLPGLHEIVYRYEKQDALLITYSPSVNGHEGVVSLGLYPGEVKLFFGRGAELAKADPTRLLRGSGKTVRHVVLARAADVGRAEIEALLAAALRLAKLRPRAGARGSLVFKVEGQQQRAARASAKPAPARKAAARKIVMKAYPSFDAYLADQPPANQTVIRALRKLVKRAAPALVEGVKYGNGCWLQGKYPLAYVYAAPDHTQFGFIAGARLKDPKHLLEGKGAYVRHVPLRSTRDIAERDLVALLTQAVALGHPAAKR